MEKIIHKTLRQEVVEVIRMKILTGEIPPGERIKEQDMAEDLGVSRGPVREALRQIEQEGLIQYISHVGCSVKSLTNQDVYEIYLLRASLENLAVKLCEGKFSQKCLDEMERIVDLMANIEDETAFDLVVEYDNAFHACIIQEAKLERLYRLWASLNGSNQTVFYSEYKNDKLFGVRNQTGIHQQVLDAFKTGCQETISEALTTHYMSTIVGRFPGKDLEKLGFKVGLNL